MEHLEPPSLLGNRIYANFLQPAPSDSANAGSIDHFRIKASESQLVKVHSGVRRQVYEAFLKDLVGPNIVKTLWKRKSYWGSGMAETQGPRMPLDLSLDVKDVKSETNAMLHHRTHARPWDIEKDLGEGWVVTAKGTCGWQGESQPHIFKGLGWIDCQAFLPKAEVENFFEEQMSKPATENTLRPEKERRWYTLWLIKT